ncbi:MAG: DegT/DnrJ/EryC1/StrS family aminotransferase [Candidatus Kuenenia stuttgartiensis]|uniref:Uncharacterized protein n=1 Tax=Kuenenia stuttgartiensis TaxID=174633 RepID=A0A2C9CFI1_KUEST|nr:DegT/DnrJ/EryC1/StrS family aminotransferase [Candidatus Kuenenia stuttgartiensis]MBZ0191154.1 DegT/DnrJ/EryC1/StrS family aminotransferase [Candidatus Kuenenia stuttgartiensis]MCZ7611779.1 DegT/DnrJ/EryC1/StrS family aminotransferase [Ignavibacterium sp.]SOH04446.1 hypothetical protein KSMBR1_1948 [Candidatus Kuenenia stuttgartiensis]
MIDHKLNKLYESTNRLIKTILVRAGAIPVLVDSGPITWNMDVGKLKIKLEDEIDRKGNKKIKVIMVVHIYGLPVILAGFRC